MTDNPTTHDVGGVLMPRPFRIRRLGHFGLYFDDLDAAVAFYSDALGFSITDSVTAADLLPPEAHGLLARMSDPRMIFTTYSSDHHSLLLVHKSFSVLDGPNHDPHMTSNQITWQVGSLDEVIDGYHFLKNEGVEVVRVGRDMPGSNWHVYFLDPDGYTVELYYGIEQIGWQRASKPHAMHYRGFNDEPDRPQMSEWAEVAAALDRGIDVDSGFRPALPEQSFDVGGVLLERPFKVTKLGPVQLFVTDLDVSLDFYTRLLGFQITETTEIAGHRCVFLRHGAEHHSLALYPMALREHLGLSPHTTLAALGVEVGTYRQLRAAVQFLEAKGYRSVDLPREFYPGIDVAAHVQDPDGHLVQLYYYMEQLGWDGRPRPQELRRPPVVGWPETLDALSDTYVDQTFPGPLG